MAEISREYAEALFMLAAESNKADEYGEALGLLENAFCENPEYILFLSSRSIPQSERIGAIDEAFSDKLPEEVVSYLKLLCEKGRIPYFSESVCEYKKLLDASKRVTTAKVTSAVELTEEEKIRLTEKLEKNSGCKVSMEYFIDESLLGGMIVETDGKVIDGSLRTRLRNIKEVINE